MNIFNNFHSSTSLQLLTITSQHFMAAKNSDFDLSPTPHHQQPHHPSTPQHNPHCLSDLQHQPHHLSTPQNQPRRPTTLHLPSPLYYLPKDFNTDLDSPTWGFKVAAPSSSSDYLHFPVSPLPWELLIQELNSFK